MTPDPVQSLWLGGPLPTMVRLSIASFVACGHEYHLYSYGPVDDLPAGVVLRDANAVVSSSEIFTYADGFGKGSYSAFSNLFRYQLLWTRGGWWVDADVLCLKPFLFGEKSVIASEWEDPADRIGTVTSSSVFRLPAGSPLMKEAVQACLARDRRSIRWGEIGPRLLDTLVNRHELAASRLGPEVFSPVRHVDWRRFIDPAHDISVGEDTHAVHLWHQMWRAHGVDPDGTFDPTCWYERQKARVLGHPSSASNAVRVTATATPTLRIIALIAVYNEADIIGQVIEHLHRQGVDAYVIDDGSTDGTDTIAQSFIGRGLIGYERRPAKAAGFYEWAQLLRRKEELARELDADWFMHHDADEFRESPWRTLTLRDAIAAVDRTGYNAIDFAVLDFWPVREPSEPPSDIRQTFRHYEHSPAWNRVQVKCWKKTGERVDLAASGGHDVAFDGRRVFPRRFLLRHYPLRGTVHATRKIFTERRGRFLADERELGWHVQYDHFTAASSFVRDPTDLSSYEPVRVRMEIAAADATARATSRDRAPAEAAAAAAHRTRLPLRQAAGRTIRALAMTLERRLLPFSAVVWLIQRLRGRL